MEFMSQQGTLIAAAMKQPYVQPAQDGMTFGNVTMRPSALCLGRLPQAATQDDNMNWTHFSCSSKAISHVIPNADQPDKATEQRHTRPSSKAEQTLMGSKRTVRASQNATSAHPTNGVEIAKRQDFASRLTLMGTDHAMTQG